MTMMRLRRRYGFVHHYGRCGVAGEVILYGLDDFVGTLRRYDNTFLMIM